MSKITQLSQLDVNQTYSYADYVTWRLDEAIELIKGKISLMSPTPNVQHQAISGNLHGICYPFFREKKCRIFAAPFDVRWYDRKKSLLASQDIHTEVQPDLCVICNPEILDEQGLSGAPDWILEILSKGNSKQDMQVKQQLYAESEVQEYWIVYPNDQAIHQFILDAAGRYQLTAMYTDDDVATPLLFPELQIELSEVFETWRDQ